MAREKFKLRVNFTEREEHRKFHAQTAGLDGWWEIVGKPVRPQRSLKANAYYHAAAVEKFREYMSREHRQHFTHDQCTSSFATASSRASRSATPTAKRWAGCPRARRRWTARSFSTSWRRFGSGFGTRSRWTLNRPR